MKIMQRFENLESEKLEARKKKKFRKRENLINFLIDKIRKSEKSTILWIGTTTISMNIREGIKNEIVCLG